MCLFAETTSLYICLGLPKKGDNDFQTSFLNSPNSCTSSFKPTETANQNLRLVHFSLSVSSLFFLSLRLYFFFYVYWLKLTFFPVTLYCPVLTPLLIICLSFFSERKSKLKCSSSLFYIKVPEPHG